ncbi:glycosyltransferase [Actomonas aquatica]|uniref:Glycosyltransferase n=1 Tax=Actomonas aquatica TaxID=2866162 RepID=A0ABZ1C4T4_9BACT|nr:glycosyltransferase [Opitutus sp. WL0086]WRQ86743.1 glycosyltransferase [Opitutus sp. WL0086]
MSEMPSLLHVASWVRSIGGVETLLAQHARADAAAGLKATQVSLFDRPPFGGEPEPGYVPLRLGGWSTVRAMRRAMAGVGRENAGALVLWHNGWGLPWFAPADRSARRIVCLWDSVEHFGPWLASVRSWLDGVICMSAAAREDVRRLLPDWPEERTQVLRVPLAAPAGLVVERTRGAELVIGCAGRLVKAQKRWERLVPFVAELRRLGVAYRIEVVSDGPLRPWLQQRLGDDARIAFLGWQDRAAYWQRLQRWDVALSFTDHEGGPIVMLEAMAAGALPVYPAIGGSLVRDYLPGLDARSQYAVGDPVAAARAVQAWAATTEAEVQPVRARAQEIAAGHRPEHYDADFAAFARRIAALPRVSRDGAGEMPRRWWDVLPLGVVTRLMPGALWR